MIAFCTTCKNRTGHLRKTLPKNMSDNPKSKFIILDYNSEDDLLEFLKNDMSQEITSGRLIVYSYRDWHKFRLAHAKNMAHRLGMLEGATILCNLDADNYTGLGFEDFIIEQFEKDKNIILWACMVKGEMTRGISGRIVITKEAFIKVGGYNEKFVEWSADDKDFNLRLQIAGYKPVEIARQYLDSIPHNAKIRFKEYPHLMKKEPEYFHFDKSFIQDSICVNSGLTGIGRVRRNFSSVYVNIKPLTPKVFGVGLHKTATSSLSEALKIIGYHTWHWNSAHQAKAIWQQMNNEGYSRVIEGYHAITDLPIPLLYKQLDKAYPNSKYILTLRDKNLWIDSVRRHYRVDSNVYRSVWDNDPFTHRVHQLLYGTPDFNEEIMLKRYEHQTDEVKKYFKNKPEQLLIMDGTHDWKRLCEFLKVPIPDASYPREYVTKQ